MRSIVFATLVSTVVAGQYSASNDKSSYCPAGTSSTDYGETCVDSSCPIGSVLTDGNCICQDGTSATEIVLSLRLRDYTGCYGLGRPSWLEDVSSTASIELYMENGSIETVGPNLNTQHDWWCVLKIKRCVVSAKWGTPTGQFAADLGSDDRYRRQVQVKFDEGETYTLTPDTAGNTVLTPFAFAEEGYCDGLEFNRDTIVMQSVSANDVAGCANKCWDYKNYFGNEKPMQGFIMQTDVAN